MSVSFVSTIINKVIIAIVTVLLAIISISGLIPFPITPLTSDKILFQVQHYGDLKTMNKVGLNIPLLNVC